MTKHIDLDALHVLAPCPFCGGAPRMTSRPDNRAGTEFVGIVSCNCGGYSACAHKMVIASTQDEANEKAIAAWNRRAPADDRNWQLREGNPFNPSTT